MYLMENSMRFINPACHQFYLLHAPRLLSSTTLLHLYLYTNINRGFICSTSFSATPNSISLGNRSLSVAASFKQNAGIGTQIPSFQEGESFFRSVLAYMEAVCLNRNPTAKAILELVHSVDTHHIYYDHLAFRTFG